MGYNAREEIKWSGSSFHAEERVSIAQTNIFHLLLCCLLISHTSTVLPTPEYNLATHSGLGGFSITVVINLFYVPEKAKAPKPLSKSI